MKLTWNLQKKISRSWSPSIWSISLSWCEDYFNLGLDDEAILDLLLYVSCQFEPLDCSFVAKSLFILVQVVPPNRDELRSFTSSKYTATPAWRHTRTLWHTGDTGLVTPGRPGTDRVHGPWVWMTCVILAVDQDICHDSVLVMSGSTHLLLLGWCTITHGFAKESRELLLHFDATLFDEEDECDEAQTHLAGACFLHSLKPSVVGKDWKVIYWFIQGHQNWSALLGSSWFIFEFVW